MPQLIPGSGADKFFRTLGKVKERYNANLDQSPGAFNQPGAGGLIGRPLDSAPAPSAGPTQAPTPASVPASAASAAGGAAGPTMLPTVRAAPPVGADGVRGPSFQNVSDAPRRGDLNTFTGSNGITRSIASTAQPTREQIVDQAFRRTLSPAPVATMGSQAPQVQATTQRALGAVRGNTLDARADAVAGLNPMSADAELMRRLEISQGYGSFKGSPQARRLAGEALLGQIGARNAASATGQQAANAIVQQGAQGEGVANEAFARRRLDADRGNQQNDQITAQRLAEMGRPSQSVRGLDGITTIVRNDGSAATLRDEAGRPIQTPAPATAGAITQQDLLKAQSAERAAAAQIMDPVERKAAMDSIDARYESRYSALGGGAAAKPTLQQFLAAARQANPNVSDADLTSYYNSNYGR